MNTRFLSLGGGRKKRAKGERVKAKGMDQVLKGVSKGFSPSPEQPEEKNLLQKSARGHRRCVARPGAALAVAMATMALLHSASCGVKAPPRPRELVVPAPVEDVAVEIVPDGLEITFTLPSKSLDGFPLERIGGYRILREGPDGEVVREDVRFSVSEMRQRAGKRVVFPDEPPEQPGTYRYCVMPMDAYGSHPSRRQTVEFCWEGFLSDERVLSDEGGLSNGGFSSDKGPPP
jgi:hypothetical protein